MYELRAGEIMVELADALERHNQSGPIVYVVATGFRPMLCYFTDPLKDGKLQTDNKGRIRVNDGKREMKIPLVKIQKVMLFDIEDLLEIMKLTLKGIDTLADHADKINLMSKEMKSKILDLGLSLYKPWIKL